MMRILSALRSRVCGPRVRRPTPCAAQGDGPKVAAELAKLIEEAQKCAPCVLLIRRLDLLGDGDDSSAEATAQAAGAGGQEELKASTAEWEEAFAKGLAVENAAMAKEAEEAKALREATAAAEAEVAAAEAEVAARAAAVEEAARAWGLSPRRSHRREEGAPSAEGAEEAEAHRIRISRSPPAEELTVIDDVRAATEARAAAEAKAAAETRAAAEARAAVEARVEAEGQAAILAAAAKVAAAEAAAAEAVAAAAEGSAAERMLNGFGEEGEEGEEGGEGEEAAADEADSDYEFDEGAFLDLGQELLRCVLPPGA